MYTPDATRPRITLRAIEMLNALWNRLYMSELRSDSVAIRASTQWVHQQSRHTDKNSRIFPPDQDLANHNDRGRGLSSLAPHAALHADPHATGGAGSL